MTDKQEIFCDEYLIDENATQAAIRAGYSNKTAGQIGCQLLKKVHIQRCIEEKKLARSKRTHVNQDYVINNFVTVANRCMQAEPVMEKIDGEWVKTGEWKFDSAGANKALESLGRHLGMFTDNVTVGAGLVFNVVMPNDRVLEGKEARKLPESVVNAPVVDAVTCETVTEEGDSDI